MKTNRLFLLLLLTGSVVTGCKKHDCTPNTALEGRWKQAEVIAGQPFLGFEVDYKNAEGQVTNVSANAYRFVIGDVVWKDVTPETSSIYDANVLIRFPNGTSRYERWKIAVLAGGTQLAFTKPGNTTDVYQRWVKMD
jgi:hypothetical protein